MEVDEWTGFTRHFTHIKSGEAANDKTLLLTAILADAINLGLTKMAESCPGTTYAKLSWLQAWHIRDETYSAALAELVNAQFRQPFAAHWGDGTTSSSDGQRFKAGGHAEARGHINPKYGSEPGVLFYTHVSDQYAPFHTKVINVGVRDATYVLDGLLYHESDLRIEEHYTDTAGFTDHVFALMHLLGFRFAPRIRDLADKRLFVPGKPSDYPALAALIGGTINAKPIRTHWDEILRLATSIRAGHGDRLADAAQARQLPAPERPGRRAARAGADRTHAVHPRLAAERRAAPPRPGRAQQGRGQERLGPGRVLQPAGRDARPELREPALSRQRPEPGDGGHRALEHGLSGAGGSGHQGSRPDRSIKPCSSTSRPWAGSTST